MTDLVPGLEGDTVLDQMNRLFEPPGKAGVEDVGEAHPYFKRPGRGHNHDSCDSCSEGGALICCDLCPASFHLQCHDPPLSDSEIPEGDWSCIQCFSKTEECQRLVAEARRAAGGGAEAGRSNKEAAVAKVVVKEGSSSSSLSSKSPEKVDSDWRPGSKRKVEVGRAGRATRAVNKRTHYTDHSTEDEEEAEVEEPPVAGPSVLGPVFSHSGKNYRQLYVEQLARRPKAPQGGPLALLLAAASQENAKEFQLPHSFGQSSNTFPFSWKWSSEQDRKRLKGGEGEPELEPGQNKIRLCYSCVRSSRLGPLISCDFCPCAFHMDCLDPPLSEVPRDVWMCPNHVENWLDSKLLTSTSATERVKLWDRFARQPLDSHGVKLQFLRRCQRAKSRVAGRRLPARARHGARVPGGVKAAYREPSTLLPSTVREECCGGRREGGEEELEWLAGLVTLQTQMAREKLEARGDGTDTERDNEDVKSMKVDVKSEDSGENSPTSTLSACSLSPRHTSQLSAPHPSLPALLSDYLAQHSTAPVSHLHPTVVQYLAHKQLQTIFPPAPAPGSEVRARASLSLLHSRRAPALMQYRSLDIGAGEGRGLDLAAYGSCSQLSRQHATIFYDELSGEYELLNYSGQGTRVDGVLYRLDLAGMEGRYPPLETVSPVPRMAGRPGPGGAACPCRGAGRGRAAREAQF